MPRPPVRTDLIPSRRSEFVMKRPPTHGEGHGLIAVAEIEPPVIRETWQQDAYSFVEAIGEMAYALNLKAQTVSECRIRPEIRIADTDEWEETDDPRVLRVLAAFKPPQGGQGELLRQATLHYEIAGETYLYGAPIKDERDRPLGLVWEFLSTLECRIEGDGRVIRNAWGGSRGREEVAVDAYVARLHRRDPRYSERADCPVRRILPICRELVLLTQVIDAVAKSRLAAGLLYVPWEISPLATPDEFEDVGEPETGFDEFEDELARHLNAPIEDRTASSSLNPLLMRGPAMLGDKLAKEAIGIIDLSRPLDGIYKELRQEALTRMAGGLDIPPEILTGKANLNHWTGANIDADFIAKHVTPVGNTVTDFLTTAFLRPMLTIYEGMDPEDADWFRLSLDTAPITGNIDHSQSATTGVSLDIVSDEAWLRLNGLDEADAADLPLRKRRSLERLLYAQPTLGPAILPVLYPDDPEIAEAVKNWKVGESAPGGAQGGPAAPGAPGVPPPNFAKPAGVQAPGAPMTPGPPPVMGLAGIDDIVIAGLLAACDRELDRAIVTAANRLLGRLNGIDKAYTARLRSEPRSAVLSIAGREWAAKAGLGAEELFSGCWDQLKPRVEEWLHTALVAGGAEPYGASQIVEVAAAELCRQLTLHGSTVLDKPIAIGPNGYRVPTELVLSALAAGDLTTMKS